MATDSTTKRDDGGPAFARSIGHGTLMIANEPRNIEVGPQAGMSLRDFFAGQALANTKLYEAAMADYGTQQVGRVATMFANRAYEIADAMLEARK